MRVKLASYTKDPEQIVASAARLCYSNADIDHLMARYSAAENASFIRMLSRLGHESPLEHASFSFGIDGVSRSLLAQITRHRIASYSVQSQRYVRMDSFGYVTPPEIAENEDAAALFADAIDSAKTAYRAIAELLQKKHYESYLKEGFSNEEASSRAEKQAIEDARFVLPNASDTKMMVTMNARSLKNFFRQRCCLRAQWEIRTLADDMLRLVLEVAPNLFADCGPGCVTGACPEGKMSCGKTAKVRAYYQTLCKEAKNG